MGGRFEAGGSPRGVGRVPFGMPTWLETYLVELWSITTDTGLWLIVGLLFAGVTHAFIPKGWLEKQLGGNGLKPILKASALGVPLPLCSCSVIPVAAGLREQGASKGASAAFAISTPQTGEESIPLTWALFGPVFALARPVIAIATAFTAGVLIEKTGDEATERRSDEATKGGGGGSCCHAAAPAPAPKPACCHTEGADDENPSVAPSLRRSVASALHYAFVTMLVDLAPWLAAGLLLAALVGAAAPEDWIAAHLGGGFLPLLLAAVIGIPLYICATSSTPLAATLVAAGMSPGAALVLLLAGPATNTATMAWVIKDLGGKALAIYLAVIFVFAVAAGWAFDALLGATVTASEVAAHEHGANAIESVAAAVFGVLLVGALAMRFGRLFRTSSDAPELATE